MVGRWCQGSVGTAQGRPPFGSHNPEVDATAAGLGLDQVVQWNGSFGDATLVSPGFLLAQARRYLQ